MKLFLMLCCILATTSLAVSRELLKRNYVPNSETAITIAEAVFIPVYGRKQIESERAFTATLRGDVWTVAGTLNCSDGKPQTDKPPTCAGGVAVVKISKMNARIISMTHYK